MVPLSASKSGTTMALALPPIRPCWQSKAHVAQFVGIARDIDGDDAAVTVIEGHRIDGAVLLAQHKARQTVDGGSAHLNSMQSGVLARNSSKEAQNLVDPIDWIERRGALAATIRIEHRVLGQQSTQRLRVAGFGRHAERSRQTRSDLGRSCKAGSAGLDMRAGAGSKLAAGGLAAAERVGHLGKI